MSASFDENISDELLQHDADCELCTRDLPLEVNKKFTFEEVDKCVRSLKNAKSPGPDGLVNELFKNSNNVLLQCLSEFLM